MTPSVSAPETISRAPARWVFAILVLTYAFFWQSRDWNSASRLMLTYALVDRGTIAINGLERQTGDKAYYRGRFYTDKLPGFSLLAVPPYVLARTILRLPRHPLDQPGFAYWPADYWVTLGTSGVGSAMLGALIAHLAALLGCGPRRSLLVGLAYGLATPAYVYATMSYGHQLSALALFGAFLLLWRPDARHPRLAGALAGFLAALGPVIELQVGPVAAILGLYAIVQAARKALPASAVATFAMGAMIPTLILLGYNVLAFGSPWDMGYFHHATLQFAKVHSHQNPLGLRSPDGSHVVPLLWGDYRGLLFYAPILALGPPGWVALIVRKQWAAAVVSAAVCVAVFLVNLCYPEWTGGWSTGPRLLLPLLPFAMIPVAGLLGTSHRVATGLAVLLAVWGGVLMLLFVGVGGRIPQDVGHPLSDVVWPLWRGEPLPVWWPGTRFTRNLGGMLLARRLADGWHWLQFLPLVAVQAGLIGMALRHVHRDGGRNLEQAE